MREIDRELNFLAKRMKAARVIDPAAQTDHTRVLFGATVEIADDDDARLTLTLVGALALGAALGRRGSRATDPTSTPAFRRWFGESKVVDAEGRPLVVFHGTGATFDAFDTVEDCLEVLTGALATATFSPERMRAALVEGFVEATEVADWLAARAVPFREAHHVAGRLVRLCVERRTTLPSLSLEDFRSAHPAFDESIFEAIEPEVAIERRSVLGGPARGQVRAQIEALASRLAARGVEVEPSSDRPEAS